MHPPGYDQRMGKRHITSGEHTVYWSLQEFMNASTYPAGVLTVMRGGLPIDVRHDPRGYETTTVFFHAAVAGGKYRLPLFAGARISETMPTNRVHVADPSLYLADNLHLGWYAGNHKQPRLQWVIRGILNHLIPAGQKVVTFGSSGGGFAALYYAARREGAVAVPVNPQTNLARYSPVAVARYARLAWGLTGEDVLSRVTAATDLTRLYRASARRVFYVQNQNDRTHMEGQYRPFMAALPEGHEVHPVLVDGEDGHVPPARATIRSVLAAAVAGAEVPPGITASASS